jgi:hypothetical protein
METTTRFTFCYLPLPIAPHGLHARIASSAWVRYKQCVRVGYQAVKSYIGSSRVCHWNTVIVNLVARRLAYWYLQTKETTWIGAYREQALVRKHLRNHSCRRHNGDSAVPHKRPQSRSQQAQRVAHCMLAPVVVLLSVGP